MIGAQLAAPGGNAPGLLVRGEPGIGKTALLTAAARRARAAGRRVLSASGVESEIDLPFSGLHQLLHPLREHRGSTASVLRPGRGEECSLADMPSTAPITALASHRVKTHNRVALHGHAVDTGAGYHGHTIPRR